MKRLLIGITGTPNSAKREITRLICEELHVRHFNIQQPVLDACAALTGLDAYEFYMTPGNTDLPIYNQTVAQMIKRIHAAVTYVDRKTLLNALELRIASTKHIAHIFGGTLVDGISRDLEANWLREQGGTLIHLHNVNRLGIHQLVKVENEDILYTANNRAKIIAEAIPAVIESLRLKMREVA